MSLFQTLIRQEQETEETDIDIIPWSPPGWTPWTGGTELVPTREQGIERIIEEATFDGRLATFKREIIYIQTPEETPEPQPAEPHGVYTVPTSQAPFVPTLAQQQQWAADVRAGRAVFLGGPCSPEEAIRRQLAQPRVRDGRIFLQE